MRYGFEWDAFKARANASKHGVTFDEAKSVFVDRWSIDMDDPEHSLDEERLLIIGMSDHNRVLTIAYTLRDYSTVRIISARRATRNEKHDYEEKIRNRR